MAPAYPPKYFAKSISGAGATDPVAPLKTSRREQPAMRSQCVFKIPSVRFWASPCYKTITGLQIQCHTADCATVSCQLTKANISFSYYTG